jgi:hypothetical protein
MMACQEMEARLEEEEPTSVDMKPKAAQEKEVPVEDATVMLVGEPKKKRSKDQKMAVEHRRQRKKRAQNQIGYQKLLAVVHSRTSHRANVARQKETVVGRNCTMAVIERATQRVGLLKKNLQMHHKGTKDRRGKRPLHGRKKRTTTDGIQKWSPGDPL